MVAECVALCHNSPMTEDQVKQLQAIYDEAIVKLQQLTIEKQHIIKGYIKELEEAKMKALRESLGMPDAQQ